MRLLLSSDWHLRVTSPENRVDDFFATQVSKIQQIFTIFKERNCQYILQAGDLFDTPRPSFGILETFISLFNKYNINDKNLLAVAGQHDLRFRTEERTAFKLMRFLGFIQKVDTKITLSENIDLYGASWGDEIPIIEDADKFNILLIHKTIIDKKTHFWQEDYLLSSSLFKKYLFDIVLAGDNHSPVFYQNGDRTILGCGTISRKTIAEAGIIPHIYILDINEENLIFSLKKIELDYRPAHEVFRAEALSRETVKENAKLNSFIESIKSNEISTSLDFRKNLETMMKSSDKAVKDIIINSLMEIENEA